MKTDWILIWLGILIGVAIFVSCMGCERTLAPEPEVQLSDTPELPLLPPNVIKEDRSITTELYPGDDIQAAVASHPPGTTFFIQPGIHRIQAILPKRGNTFIGFLGSILSGAKVLTEFTYDGFWIAEGQTQQSSPHGNCQSAYPGCKYNEDLFIDDVALIQVESLAGVVPGTWYFDYNADKIYFADDPTGRKVEASATRTAFRFTTGQDNVTIRNLTIEKYSNPAQWGAISADNSTGWRVENCDIRWNHGVGIRSGHEMKILNNKVHHNGQLGMGGLGDNILVEGNEIYENNTAFFSIGWEAGGTKFVRTNGLIVRGNNSHNNRGPGFWTDGFNDNTLYENNIIRDNDNEGIFHEISYAVVIRNNLIEGNGFPGNGYGTWLYHSGILIAHSPDAEIYGNTVTNNFNGICGIYQHRTDGGLPHLLQNLYVHDNIIRQDFRGWHTAGIAQDAGVDSVYYNWNNRFEDNTYYLNSTTRNRFAYTNSANRTIEQWKNWGNDVNGIFIIE